MINPNQRAPEAPSRMTRSDTASAVHWQQAGRVWLWRYPGAARNFPGWHLTADADGAASLCALLDTFASDAAPAFRTVRVSPLTPRILSVPNNGDAACQAPARLRLALSPMADAWLIAENDDSVTFTLGRDWLATLRTAVAAMRIGDGDFSIGPAQGERLWLWWYPAAVKVKQS